VVVGQLSIQGNAVLTSIAVVGVEHFCIASVTSFLTVYNVFQHASDKKKSIKKWKEHLPSSIFLLVACTGRGIGIGS
jgi:dolichyl-phosphate-mannose--protein O-mannosyl transferase